MLMRPGPVAGLFRVDPKTAVRWSTEGRIRTVRTPGGHHMFIRADILALVGADVLSGRVRLLLPEEVGEIFDVDHKTPVRWVAEGKLKSIRTPSGHHRFREDEVKAFLRVDPALIKEIA